MRAVGARPVPAEGGSEARGHGRHRPPGTEPALKRPQRHPRQQTQPMGSAYAPSLLPASFRPTACVVAPLAVTLQKQLRSADQAYESNEDCTCVRRFTCSQNSPAPKRGTVVTEILEGMARRHPLSLFGRVRKRFVPGGVGGRCVFIRRVRQVRLCGLCPGRPEQGRKPSGSGHQLFGGLGHGLLFQGG